LKRKRRSFALGLFNAASTLAHRSDCSWRSELAWPRQIARYAVLACSRDDARSAKRWIFGQEDICDKIDVANHTIRANVADRMPIDYNHYWLDTVCRGHMASVVLVARLKCERY
jgi:hypothetical protein